MERAADIVAPELHAHGAHGGVADAVGNAGDIDVEGADGKVGVPRRGRDECLEDVRGGVEFAVAVGLVNWDILIRVCGCWSNAPEEIQTVASRRLHFGCRGRPASTAAAAGAAGGLRSVQSNAAAR